MTSACPYCRAPFEPEEEVTTCEACVTPHHADCYAENGGCTVFGCAKAPVDEPKLSISQSDLSQTVGTVSSGSPPPPPRPGLTTAVPPPPRPGQPKPEAGPVRREFTFGGYNVPTDPAVPIAARYTPRHSRLTYILLGVFLGAFGAHNFYAGYTKRAVSQLLLTLLTLFIASLITWIWAVIEVCVVTQDGDGVAFV